MSGNPKSFMFVFPGQGSQYRGMGSDVFDAFPAARRVYQRASEALEYDMTELSFRDPKEHLDLTAYTQPALLTHSIACIEAFQELVGEPIEPTVVAGHSLGEYTALVVAGALALEDALRLVRRRGELMSEHGTGQMLAIGKPVDELRPLAERNYCGIGGCNLPNQTVIGGLEKDLQALLADLRKEDPRARGTILRTEGAFHTYLMVNAATHFRGELESVTLSPPRCQVLSNYTGEFHEPDPAGIRYRLFFQLFHPVKWIWGMQRALERGIGAIVEFGGGLGGDSPATMRPNLASIINRIVKAREARSGPSPGEISALDFEALYAPAINVQTIRQAAHLASSVRRLQSERADGRGERVADRSCSLYVPTAGGIPLAAAVPLLQSVQELGLAAQVDLIGQDVAANQSFLAAIDPDLKKPAAYLEVASASEKPVYATGAAIDETLRELKRQLSS